MHCSGHSACEPTRPTSPAARDDENRSALDHLWRFGAQASSELWTFRWTAAPLARQRRVCWLAAASECLRAQFTGSFSDSARNNITIHEVDGAALEYVLGFHWRSLPDSAPGHQRTEPS